MDYSDLTEEQKTKAKACKTPEEILALAKEEGYELTEAELEAVGGGTWRAICSMRDYERRIGYRKD